MAPYYKEYTLLFKLKLGKLKLTNKRETYELVKELNVKRASGWCKLVN